MPKYFPPTLGGTWYFVSLRTNVLKYLNGHKLIFSLLAKEIFMLIFCFTADQPQYYTTIIEYLPTWIYNTIKLATLVLAMVNSATEILTLSFLQDLLVLFLYNLSSCDLPETNIIQSCLVLSVLYSNY